MEKISTPGSKLKYWLRRLWKNGAWIALFAGIFTIMIPAWYTWNIRVPPLDALQRREGVLTYKFLGNRFGAQVGITNDNGTDYFTCRESQLGKRHDCLVMGFEELKPLKGKPAEVLWFEQKVNIGSTQKQLARLVVAGEEKVSLDKTIRRFEIARQIAIWMPILFVVLAVVIVCAFDKNLRKKEADEQRSS